MPRLDEVSLSILNRMIEQRSAQLRSAELGNNLHLATRLRSEIRGLRAGRRKLESGGGTGGPLWARARREPSQSARTFARRPSGRARRPTLKDDATVVDPHGARWEALTLYLRRLNQSFPLEDLTSLAGFFSTEREFARHIRAIEDRLPTRSRSRSRPAARKATRRKATRGTRKPARRSSRTKR